MKILPILLKSIIVTAIIIWVVFTLSGVIKKEEPTEVPPIISVETNLPTETKTPTTTTTTMTKKPTAQKPEEKTIVNTNTVVIQTPSVSPTSNVVPIIIYTPNETTITTQTVETETVIEISNQEMNVGQIYEWQGAVLWIATTGSKVGDTVTMTINGYTDIKTVESISGKQSIWSGFNVENLDKTQTYPVRMRIDRGKNYTTINFTI